MIRSLSPGREENGLALLEMVIVLGIISILGTAGMASLSRIQVVKFETETKRVLNKVREGYEAYYKNKGKHPSNITDIAEHIQQNAPIKDGWGQDVSMFRNATVSVDGRDVSYDAAIVSGGSDASVDTNATNPFQCSSDDYCAYVTIQSLRETKINKTIIQTDRFQDAWITIYNTEGVQADSFADFDGYAINHPSYAGNGVTPLDPWNSEYNATFGSSAEGGHFEITSRGPDKKLGTKDDISAHITDTRFNETHRSRTKNRIARANEARNTYEADFGSLACGGIPNTCVRDLVYDPNGNLLMKGVNTYGTWGVNLSYNPDISSFVGAGPDGCFIESQGTTCPDDNVVP